MFSDMLSGFVKVIYWAGLILGILLVLAIVGAVNQHAKLASMAAVGAGFGDVLRWAGSLLSQALRHL
jgi:hypothetical protein